MRNQLASIELRALVGELKQLENARLDRVYDVYGHAEGKQLVFQLNKSEGTKRFLVCLAPSAVFSSAKKPQTGEQPGNFCTFLRKHLDNSRLVSVSQLGSERVVELVFSSKGGLLKLMVELFSKGNLLLVDDKGVILAAAEQQSWKDRTLRTGFRYSLPPASADYANLTLEQFSGVVLSSERDSVVKCLATELGLSGAYAEELCGLASVDKLKKPSEVSKQELGQLFSSLQAILSAKPSPVAVLDDNGRVSEVFPFLTAASKNAKTKAFQSFNEAVEALSLQQLQASITSPAESSLSRKIREMEIAIEQQKATVSEMEKAVRENTRIAELIYEHYMDVKQVLDGYNTLRKTFTKEQLREYFSSSKLVKNIDEKTGTVVMEISDDHVQ